VVVLINKWALKKDLEDVNSAAIEDQLEAKLPHAPWAMHLFISAKTGKGVHRVLSAIDKSFAAFNTRLPTGRLNRFLQEAVAAHSVPQKHNKPVRLYYATQARVRPPTIVVWSNSPEGVPVAYRRYLQNRLRERFGFEGTPLKVHFRKRRELGEAKSG